MKDRDEWEKPRSKGVHLTSDEIALVKVGFAAKRTIQDVARELKCSSRTVSKYYGWFRAEGVPQGGRKHSAALPARHYKSSFEL